MYLQMLTQETARLAAKVCANKALLAPLKREVEAYRADGTLGAAIGAIAAAWQRTPAEVADYVEQMDVETDAFLAEAYPIIARMHEVARISGSDNIDLLASSIVSELRQHVDSYNPEIAGPVYTWQPEEPPVEVDEPETPAA